MKKIKIISCWLELEIKTKSTALFLQGKVSKLHLRQEILNFSRLSSLQDAWKQKMRNARLDRKLIKDGILSQRRVKGRSTSR